MRRRASLLIAAAALVIVALLLAGCASPPRASSRTAALPGLLEPYVDEHCFTDAALPVDFSDASTGLDKVQVSIHGSGDRLVAVVESPDSWQVVAGRSGVEVTRQDGSADTAAGLSAASIAVGMATRMRECMAPYRFAVPSADVRLSSSQLLQLYKYETGVLWPCLAAHGLDPGDPPTRAQFLSSFSTTTINPFRNVSLSDRGLNRAVSAARACPMTPAYLSP